MNRNLGPQFRQRLQTKVEGYISRKVAPLHEAIVRQGEANQPGIDAALGNWEKAWREAGA